MRGHKIWFRILAAAAVAALAFGAAGIVWHSKASHHDLCRAQAETAAAEISTVLDRIEMTRALVDSTMRNENDGRRYAVMTADELNALSPSEKANKNDMMRRFNAVIGVECEISVYFIRSGLTLNNNGLNPFVQYVERFRDTEGNPLALGDYFYFGYSDYIIIGNVTADYGGYGAPTTLIINTGDSQTAVVCALRNTMFENRLPADGGLYVSVNNTVVFGTQQYADGVGRSGYFDTYVSVNLPFDLSKIAVGILIWTFVVLAAFGIAFLTLRRRARSLKAKIEELNRILRREDNDSRNLVQLIREAYDQVLTMERLAADRLEGSCQNLKDIYIRMLAERRVQWNEESQAVLSLLGVDGMQPVRACVMAGDGEDIRVAPAGEVVRFSQVCGVGTIKENFGGFAESYEEALVAYKEARYRHADCIYYEHLPAFMQSREEGNAQFNAIRAYIDEHFSDHDLSLKSIAQHFGYSVSYISRTLSECGNLHYLEYVSMRRVDYAQALLQSGETVKTAAEKCGFDSAVAFRKTFKKYTGLSPTDWLNKYGKSGQ